MIRLATCFSGIGAIEHALKRMNLNYKIIFACDNGDVNILNKNVDSGDIDQIGEELSILSKVISEIKVNDEISTLYKSQLLNMLKQATKQYQEILSDLENIPRINPQDVKKILLELIELSKPKQKKEYSKSINLIEDGSNSQKKLRLFKVILSLSSILIVENKTKNNFNENINFKILSDKFSKIYNIFENSDGKKIIRKMQDLAQRTGQLYEKINYLNVQKKLEEMGTDWAKRKKYVDSLYKGLEKRNKVKESYLANYKIKETDFHWNVAFLDGNQYKNQVDLFVGGSPCQSFSLVGKQRGLEDTRGTLFYEYARLIEQIQPKVFIYENVRAVLSNDKGKTWEKMKEVFNQLGYDFKAEVLNSKDYGIPQNRERLFVVGFRKDLNLKTSFSFPKKINLEKSMKDFLIDNAPGGYFLPKKGVEFVTKEKNLLKRYTQIDGDIQLCQKRNQQFNWHGDFIFQTEEDARKNKIPDLEKYFLSEKVCRYVLSTGTKSFYSKPKTDLEIARPLLTTMHKMHRAGIDNYVTTNGRLRKLTPRECLRLMGFSDEFNIVVSNTAMYQQAGNSIVVDVLIHIMDQILICCPNLNEK